MVQHVGLVERRGLEATSASSENQRAAVRCRAPRSPPNMTSLCLISDRRSQKGNEGIRLAVPGFRQHPGPKRACRNSVLMKRLLSGEQECKEQLPRQRLERALQAAAGACSRVVALLWCLVEGVHLALETVDMASRLSPPGCLSAERNPKQARQRLR